MNPKFLLGLGATLVVMFAAYTISWYWMAGQIEKEMNGFLVTAEQEGVHIQPRAMGVRGYPGLYEAWFSGRVSAADVVVEIPLLEANSMFLPGKPLKLEAPEGISLMEPSDAEIWSLDRLFLKTDIPTTFPELTQEDLTAWRAAKNSIKFETIEIRKNSLELTGSGEFTLDKALQPTGGIQARATGHTEFIGWLQQKGVIETKQALLASTVLTAFSKTDPETNTPYLEIALTIQNRTLFAGPLPLGELPAAVWGSRNPPAPHQ